ncbi:MAG TPA: GNAT family N-acetyltransferase [Alphaproteobacteria bacterium]|nr:GNAT family N-acetyltransferase [Alphaproteobacteria bacterium]
MASSDGLVRRPLTAADIEGGFALSSDAGWNQVPADWRLMLDHGAGIAVTASDGRLAATALTHGLGAFGWISMVLVARAYRRRGIATDLIARCVEMLEKKGITPGLDATEAGRLVYEPLGFRPVYSLARRQVLRVRPADSASASIRSARPEDIPKIFAYDAGAFGLDRAHILRHLHTRAPALAHVAESGGELHGFVLGRDGRTATQVGPLMADDAQTAIALARSALERVNGPAYIDSLDGQSAFNDYLNACGFAVQRGFTRMLVGRSTPFDDPQRAFAIAGPELA